ncbi:hypothetical protein BOTBODRAFT_166498 [Botryobasidium botryosum FD-172 SS1]|uniref:Condensation domain-containing protein n=1 Tax=Botryobasidium botryosum (strain FD-172 SS1) TaxID=930990 RepID=A0A067LX57_BOTB1|nr:hypothetical protein BOTBODRAFT_166498 [Botryobasidium botryosum FD-172 SS1]
MSPVPTSLPKLADLSLNGFKHASASESKTFDRKMGDCEASYFLPSRADGVNDMYLHLGFTAPPALMSNDRVLAAWTLIRLRNPLLVSKVVMNSYEDVRFTYSAPANPEDAFEEAKGAFERSNLAKDELIGNYLNGPRTLSSDRLSYLYLSSPVSSAGSNAESQEFNFLLCTTHYLGDGMALHTTANEFLGLVGGEKSTGELKDMITEEWRAKWKKSSDVNPLPVAVEDRLSLPPGRLRKAAAAVDFQNDQRKLIGGHSLPRANTGPRKTIVPTVSFDEQKTKAILKKCKTNGVSIAHALFAICNIALIRANGGKTPELPMMMYSAMNLRPYLNPSPTYNLSYWFLAIGYYNVVLPSFLRPADVDKTFWLRAQSAKAQTAKAVKSKMLVGRCLEMSKVRGERARKWAAEDDGVVVRVPPAAKPAPVLASEAENKSKENPKFNLPPAPSSAIVGLSLLGNLDAMYAHASFPKVKLHTLTTGSRQRKGGMLMFGYTFVGKLWVSLGWDVNGFDQSVVNAFWKGVVDGVEEFLV